ncbi:unnamed protein product [Echinostoma caproni]|uniref:4_1_CTD domain-containing protein n=1 Tax=Echinostoma caproni TaxID=27848 RepID=A0A183A5W3_9TREM|nr:unnamed protein product [Echinostoma caproni]
MFLLVFYATCRLNAALTRATLTVCQTHSHQKESVQRSEPQVETESFYDENGKLIRRTIKRSEVTTTKTVSERIIAGTIDPNHALDMALHEVTKLDRDTSVLNNTVGQVEIRTKPESAI